MHFSQVTNASFCMQKASKCNPLPLSTINPKCYSRHHWYSWILYLLKCNGTASPVDVTNNCPSFHFHLWDLWDEMPPGFDMRNGSRQNEIATHPPRQLPVVYCWFGNFGATRRFDYSTGIQKRRKVASDEYSDLSGLPGSAWEEVQWPLTRHLIK